MLGKFFARVLPDFAEAQTSQPLGQTQRDFPPCTDPVRHPPANLLPKRAQLTNQAYLDSSRAGSVGPAARREREISASPPEQPKTCFDRRRTDRVLVPIPIQIIGNDPAGVTFTEEAVTVSVNWTGARISLTHALLDDDILLIKNLQNGMEAEFRVVGGFQEVFGARREWGVEAINPDSGIWGMKFDELAEENQPKVTIECAACGNIIHSLLSSIEYEVLLSVTVISRHCERCGETTRWKVRELRAETTIANDDPPPNTFEVRRCRRLKLEIPVRVENRRGVVEKTQSRDVSKSGLCFVSKQRFQVGEEIYLTPRFSDKESSVGTRGRIVWSAESPEGWVYGVNYCAAT